MKTKTAPAPSPAPVMAAHLAFFLDNEDLVADNGLDVFENVADLALYLHGKDTYDTRHKEYAAALAEVGIYPDTEEVDEVDEDDEIDEEQELMLAVQSRLTNALSSLIKVGVAWVTDEEENGPNENNNYLYADDGKSVTGLAWLTTGEKINFTIFEKKSGKWALKVACKYIV